MVIFQSDRGGTDHALNATRAAFAIHQGTARLNEEYGGVFPPIQLHMGINTGEALVGATKLGVGASQRWTFTATGSTTNVAARFAGSAQGGEIVMGPTDRKSTRLNSSHGYISYAVFCLKKKKIQKKERMMR